MYRKGGKIRVALIYHDFVRILDPAAAWVKGAGIALLTKC